MQNCEWEREVKKTELTGRSPLRRRRSALDCSVIEEEEEEEEEEQEEMIIQHGSTTSQCPHRYRLDHEPCSLVRYSDIPSQFISIVAVLTPDEGHRQQGARSVTCTTFGF
jgi:hypothetical protein